MSTSNFKYKEWVTMMCGHRQPVPKTARGTAWERRKWFLENRCLCDKCQAAVMEVKYDIITMQYWDYKDKYSSYPTVPNSYNPNNMTIKVYVPKQL